MAWSLSNVDEPVVYTVDNSPHAQSTPQLSSCSHPHAAHVMSTCCPCHVHMLPKIYFHFPLSPAVLLCISFCRKCFPMSSPPAMANQVCDHYTTLHTYIQYTRNKEEALKTSVHYCCVANGVIVYIPA